MKKETKKELIIELIFGSIFLLLFIFLILGTQRKWNSSIVSWFMLGILALAFVAAIYPFIKKDKTKIEEKIFIGVSIAILVASIIIFASVSEGIYRDPIIQISSSIVGGLIALYGIGVTIKNNRLEKEQDEIKKAKPYIFPTSEKSWKNAQELADSERELEIFTPLTTLIKTKQNTSGYVFAPLVLLNSDLSMCSLKGIVINSNNYLIFHYDSILLKGSSNCFLVNYHFKFNEYIETIELILGDMLGNTYSCFVSFDIQKIKGKPDIIKVLGTQKIELSSKSIIEHLNT